MSGTVLEVAGLRLTVSGREIVRGIDLSLRPGDVLAVIGESGAGKSLTARSLLGLAGDRVKVAATRLRVRADDDSWMDLTSATEREWRRIRGSRIGLVLQDALVALDPLRTIGRELAEAMGPEAPRTAAERRQRSVELLERVGLEHAEAFLDRRADELSGGQRQRALIATAIARSPRVLVADEPTASLDPATRDTVLRVLRELANDGLAVLLVSHDREGVDRIADTVVELRDGTLHGAAPAGPTIHRTRDDAPHEPQDASASPAIALGAHSLTKRFRAPSGDTVTALDDVSFDLAAGRTLAIMGPSGSGKTTLARLVLGLDEPDDGEILLDGERWSPAPPRVRRRRPGAVGHVPQDALSSFDPRRRVGAILTDAITGGRSRTPRAHAQAVTSALRGVGLAPELAERRPLHLSGGQRPLVAIARALAARPAVLVADEATSALDPASRDGVIDLLLELQARQGLAILLIAHDPAVVEQAAHQVLRLDAGRVV